jgi:hypothetical protein
MRLDGRFGDALTTPVFFSGYVIAIDAIISQKRVKDWGHEEEKLHRTYAAIGRVFNCTREDDTTNSLNLNS